MRKLLLFAPVAAFALTSAHAQDNDHAYALALSKVQAVGALGAMVKDWCDERVAQRRDAHAAGLNKWRKSFALDDVDAKLAARKHAAVDARGRRESLYKRLDQQSKKPDAVCGEGRQLSHN